MTQETANEMLFNPWQYNMFFPASSFKAPFFSPTNQDLFYL